jgi:hydroxymethylpyrimidine/phosphomethylpyrimidine kinase
MDEIKKVLTIAGSDCSGGAGIQADIKTITVHKMYAMSVITSLTAQNTTGVFAIQDATPDFTAAQMDAVFTDIFPDAVKIGMLSNPYIIDAVAEKLSYYKAKNIVLDPVMISTSGSRLLSEEAESVLIEKLLPLARVITPNLFEAQALTGIEVKTIDDMKKAAEKLSGEYGCAVLVKGGHLTERATDILYDGGEFFGFDNEFVDNKNTHGTGCTLSSAIACNLADGFSLNESVARAKAYLTGAIKAKLDLGKGRGPLKHNYNI